MSCMATTTTNLGLTKPDYTDAADIAVINTNMDTVDTAITATKSDLGIVEDGNTATHSITAGQYVIWKGNLYTASSAIATGTTLSTSNLTAVSNGGLNSLNEHIVVTMSDFMTANTTNANVSTTSSYVTKTANMKAIHIVATAKSNSGGWLNIGTLKTGYKPEVTTYEVCNVLAVSGGADNTVIRINANGDVDILGPTKDKQYIASVVY